MITKDAKIIKDSEERKIPIFVLTAKDDASIKSIREYLKRCIDLNCGSHHLFGIIERLEEFQLWQQNNKEKVKVPD